MKIGILSDTHDQSTWVQRALELFRHHGAECLLHCGDIESPETVALFAGWDIHFVYGNCDWNRRALAANMKAIGATNHEKYGHLERGGLTLGWTHGDDANLLHDLIVSGAYDFVFHGHTHIAGEKEAGPTRVINPGAFTRVETRTVLILETSSRLAEYHIV
jgi:putative phosphoesterase